jgi:hypothetical protein
MKKSMVAIAVALGVASAPALAGPKKMTDAQLDNVTGGNAPLIYVEVRDVVQNVQVAVPVNANAAIAANVGVLSGPQLAGAYATQRALGRQQQ